MARRSAPKNTTAPAILDSTPIDSIANITQSPDGEPQGLQSWVADTLRDGAACAADGYPIHHFRVLGRARESEKWRVLVDVRRRAEDTAESIASRLQGQIDQTRMRFMQITATQRHHKDPVSVFTVETFEDLESTEEDAEPMRGTDRVIGQALRHNEFFVNAMLRSNNVVASTLAILGQSLTGMIERYERREQAHQEERERMHEKIVDLSMRDSEEQIKAKRTEALVDAGKNLSSAIAFRLTHGAHKPDAKSEIMFEALQKLGQSLTTEQAKAFYEALTPDQFILLQSILEDPSSFADRALAAKEAHSKSKEDDGAPKS